MSLNFFFYGFLVGLAVGCPLFFLIQKSRNQNHSSSQNTSQVDQVLKERMTEAEAEKAKVSAILEHMAEGVIAVDSRKRVLLANPAVEAILGLKKGSALGRALVEVLRNRVIDEMVDRAIQNQNSIAEEIEIHHPQSRFLRVSTIGISNREGAVCAILVFYDVTEIRKLEGLRRDFLANVSHELRTPLTSIQGFIETLLSGALRDPKQSEEFLKMMEEDADRLTRLIGDLLELSQIESKEVILKPEPLELSDEFNKVITGFHPRLKEKKITVRNQLLDPKIHRVLADRDRLKQVLINLLDNAIKFNNEGGQILIKTEQVGDQVKVSIEDTGIGIPEEIVPRIFERFFRADKARSRESGGTGLGLAIVKHLIEASGGRVWCESELGKGSKFLFTLPIVP